MLSNTRVKIATETGTSYSQQHELGLAARAAHRISKAAHKVARSALLLAAGLAFAVTVTGCNYTTYHLIAKPNTYFSPSAMKKLAENTFYVAYGTSDPGLASYYTMAMVAKNVNERFAAATAVQAIRAFKGNAGSYVHSVSFDEENAEQVINEAAGITGRILPLQDATKRIYAFPKRLTSNTAALVKSTSQPIANYYYVSMLTYGIYDAPSFPAPKIGEVADLTMLTYKDVKGESKIPPLKTISINTSLAEHVTQNSTLLLARGQAYFIEPDYIGGTAKHILARTQGDLNWNRELYGTWVPVGIGVGVVVVASAVTGITLAAKLVVGTEPKPKEPKRKRGAHVKGSHTAATIV